MKSKILKLGLVLSIFFSHNAFADTGKEAAIKSLIDNYGIDNVIDVILDKRFGEITINRNGEFISAFGKPNKSNITNETILQDIDKAGLDVDAFSSLVEKKYEKKMGKKARLKKKIDTPSSPAGGKPEYTVKVRTTDADPACISKCKDKLSSCQTKVNEHSTTCKHEADLKGCLDKNFFMNQKCSGEYSSCEDTCY